VDSELLEPGVTAVADGKDKGNLTDWMVVTVLLAKAEEIVVDRVAVVKGTEELKE